jgi:hypothetical protein
MVLAETAPAHPAVADLRGLTDEEVLARAADKPDLLANHSRESFYRRQ